MPVDHLPNDVYRRQSQTSLDAPSPCNTNCSSVQAMADYPDEFFEASEEAVPILRHPYYNEVTEDLGTTAETLLVEGDQSVDFADAMEPDQEQLAENGVKENLTTDTVFTAHSFGSQVVIDKQQLTIPMVQVDIIESDQVCSKDQQLCQHHHINHHHSYSHSHLNHAHNHAEDVVEDTCHINYALLKRYLETESASQKHAQPDRFAFYSAKTGFIRASSLPELLSPSTNSASLITIMQSGAFWLDICGPSALELKVLGEVFKMHPLTLEDIQLDDVREKCDVFEDYFIVCLKAFEAESVTAAKLDYNNPVNLYVLSAGKECVVSIHHQPLHFSQTIAKRIRLLSARTGLTTDWITYGIMDDVIDSFSPAIYELECEVDEIDNACMQPGVAKIPNPEEPNDSYNVMFHRITASRKSLNLLTRLVTAKNEAVRNVLKRCTTRLSEDAMVYLRDLQDHVHTMEQSLEHADDALNRAYSNYLAHISIETSHTSNRMSKVMKTLSAFAAVTTPCTVVSCLLGMNLKGPFWPYGNDRHGPGSGSGGPFDFFLVVSFILSATVLLVYVGKRNDWF